MTSEFLHLSISPLLPFLFTHLISLLLLPIPFSPHLLSLSLSLCRVMPFQSWGKTQKWWKTLLMRRKCSSSKPSAGDAVSSIGRSWVWETARSSQVRLLMEKCCLLLNGERGSSSNRRVGGSNPQLHFEACLSRMCNWHLGSVYECVWERVNVSVVKHFERSGLEKCHRNGSPLTVTCRALMIWLERAYTFPFVFKYQSAY